MKKKYCILLLATLMSCVLADAKKYIKVWKNGAFVKKQSIDSVTFVAPNMINGHEYVDLGLPSGLLWATCNVGATKPEEYGNYFAWGETKQRSAAYKWDNYAYKSTIRNSYSKYAYGEDTLRILEASDDAATVNWGSEWRMPTNEEFEELFDGCDWTWSSDYKGSGLAGRIGVSKTNGDTIFIPAAGYRYDSSRSGAGSYGQYWSSSLYSYSSSAFACSLYFYSSYMEVRYDKRYEGRSVRAVVNK